MTQLTRSDMLEIAKKIRAANSMAEGQAKDIEFITIANFLELCAGTEFERYQKEIEMRQEDRLLGGELL